MGLFFTRLKNPYRNMCDICDMDTCYKPKMKFLAISTWEPTCYKHSSRNSVLVPPAQKIQTVIYFFRDENIPFQFSPSLLIFYILVKNCVSVRKVTFCFKLSILFYRQKSTEQRLLKMYRMEGGRRSTHILLIIMQMSLSTKKYKFSRSNQQISSIIFISRSPFN